MPPKRKSDSGEAKNGTSTKKAKEQIPDVTKLDFSCSAKTPDGKEWNMKFASWNINGIRSWQEETKCDTSKIPKEVEVEGYHSYWLSGDTEGYSGTGLYSKKEPLNVTYGIGDEAHDSEGRVITAEYEKFYFVTVYVPNAGRKLVRLDRRMEWDPAFRKYLKKLDEKKPVILCGDMNVAHLEIDLANPKGNKKNAGFTKEERESFTTLLESGFLDTFRHLYPKETGKYSFWTYMANARSKNIGWRLDYFLISDRLKDKLCESTMRTEVMGSDHCPIVCFMNI